MRILLLTQWFDPEPTFKGLVFARELAARGHDVEVLTGFPNYPGGDVYHGYRIRPWRREQIDGISILRVALYPSHNKSGFRRALNYVSLAISAAVIGTALIRKPDVVYVYSPPATIGFPAVALGFLRRVPFVYDICDLWPDTVAVSGMLSSPAALTLLDKWCNFVYRRARHIVVASPGFKQQLVRRGVPPDKIDVIYNWCDAQAIRPKEKDPNLPLAPGSGECFNVLFAGTMGVFQALDTVLETARLSLAGLPRVRFIFAGSGIEKPRLERKAFGMRLSNTMFLPHRPIHEMPAVFAHADALLLHLKDDPLFRITIPSKTQAYLAVGKPILMGVGGDAADLISRSGAGLIFQPQDPSSLYAILEKLVAMPVEQRENMGRAGRDFYERELSLKTGVTRFEEVFRAVAGGSKREACSPPDTLYSRWGKRVVDLLMTVPAVIVLLPIMGLIAAAVRLSSRGPVLFRQVRVGRCGRRFLLFKFRTMVDRARNPDRLTLCNDPETTTIGRLLRRFKLDELPQLFNILNGSMSLVGPRPCLPRLLDKLNVDGRNRLLVRPGLTGLAQVKGNVYLSWEQRWRFDSDYVRRLSLKTDIAILLRTIAVVLAGEHRFLRLPKPRNEQRHELGSDCEKCFTKNSFGGQRPEF